MLSSIMLGGVCYLFEILTLCIILLYVVYILVYCGVLLFIMLGNVVSGMSGCKKDKTW